MFRLAEIELSYVASESLIINLQAVDLSIFWFQNISIINKFPLIVQDFKKSKVVGDYLYVQIHTRNQIWNENELKIKRIGLIGHVITLIIDLVLLEWKYRFLRTYASLGWPCK